MTKFVVGQPIPRTCGVVRTPRATPLDHGYKGRRPSNRQG